MDTCGIWICDPLPLQVLVDLATGAAPNEKVYKALKDLDEAVTAGRRFTGANDLPLSAIHYRGGSPYAERIFTTVLRAIEKDQPQLAARTTEILLANSPIKIHWVRAEDLARFAPQEGLRVARVFVDAVYEQMGGDPACDEIGREFYLVESVPNRSDTNDGDEDRTSSVPHTRTPAEKTLPTTRHTWKDTVWSEQDGDTLQIRVVRRLFQISSVALGLAVKQRSRPAAGTAAWQCIAGLVGGDGVLKADKRRMGEAKNALARFFRKEGVEFDDAPWTPSGKSRYRRAFKVQRKRGADDGPAPSAIDGLISKELHEANAGNAIDDDDIAQMTTVSDGG